MVGETGYSAKCSDLETYWNKRSGKCERCPTKAGYYVTPNCGRDDGDGFHEVPNKRCRSGEFNDNSSSAVCRPCSVCVAGRNVISNCTSTSDTQCSRLRSQTTTTSPAVTISPVTTLNINQGFTSMPRTTNPVILNIKPPASGTLLLVIGVPILLVLSACIMLMMRKKGQHTLRLSYNKRPPVIEEGFSPLYTTDGNNDLEQMLSPAILSAPLQTVLNNLDVLEQLVILLDPETHGMKNTKHLASHCSFPFTWITYTYSMKESKSPLKAVLEGVTTRQPDWTVGHLAQLLRLIDRNDAIAVLEQLELTSLPTLQQAAT